MRLATCAESRRIDESCQADAGIPAEVLMEAAGALAAREIMQSFVSEVRLGGVAIFCGPGNNGADGLVVARHLDSAGVKDVAIYLFGDEDTRTSLFQKQLMRTGFIEIRDLTEFERPRLVVDALFGTGLRREVAGEFRETIEFINKLKLPVVSLDTPSGLDADRGVALGVAVRAAQTLTFGLAKPGFFLSDGPATVGRLRVLPIGYMSEIVKENARTCFAFTEAMAHRSLPKRAATGNKSSNGHALLIAGSSGTWGAALLSSSSASRVGAGYVTLASENEPIEVLKTYPEIMTAKTSDEKLWTKKFGAVGIGPGLGTDDDALDRIASIIQKLINAKIENVVVDADAITAMAKKKITRLPESWILTPHAGELSRLIDVDSKTIEADRVRYARAASEKFGCHVLLKGFRTVVARPSDGRCWIILSGNSALAKAGTGDVLTGMITGLLAQKLEPLKAACLGSYIHGRIADEWLRAGEDKRSMQASDLREILPRLIAQL